MATKQNDELQNFLDNNPEFKGEFYGYNKSNGEFYSRINDGWFEQNVYVIDFESLLKVLQKMKAEAIELKI